MSTEIDDWADLRHLDHDAPHGGMYVASVRTTSDDIGRLNYFWLAPDTIQFQEVWVHPEYRHRRVATALLRYLNIQHPEARINPGARNGPGEQWMKHILATEPDKVASNGILNVPLQNQIPNGFAWGGLVY